MALTIPFAIWKGGSAQIVEDYWRTNVILFILLGGLTTTWNEFERLLQVLAFSCVVNLVIIKVYGQLDVNGRMTLPFGALANSNDYAAHLLMLLPCVLWVALTAKSFKFRVVTLGVFGYGLFAVLSSASRGALVAVSVGIVYFLFSASNKQRIWAVGLVAVMLFAAFSLMSAASHATDAFVFQEQFCLRRSPRIVRHPAASAGRRYRLRFEISYIRFGSGELQTCRGKEQAGYVGTGAQQLCHYRSGMRVSGVVPLYWRHRPVFSNLLADLAQVPAYS